MSALALSRTLSVPMSDCLQNKRLGAETMLTSTLLTTKMSFDCTAQKKISFQKKFKHFEALHRAPYQLRPAYAEG